MELKKPKQFRILENIVTVNNFYYGMRVKRGPDWIWGNQDDNGIGTIISSVTENYCGYIWIDVNWDNHRQNSYRIGPNKFDLYEII